MNYTQNLVTKFAYFCLNVVASLRASELEFHQCSVESVDEQ